MTGLKLDPEYAKALEKTLSLLGDKPAVKPAPGDVDARRTATNRQWPILLSQLPPTPDVKMTHVGDVRSYDGFEVPLYRFARTGDNRKAPGPAVVYTHGGGYFCLCVELYSPLLSTYVSRTGVDIFAMDYRLPPEHCFPAPLEDCYAGLRYVHDNSAQFGVDPERIAVMGDSAGGGLCAGTAILARNRGLKLAKQLVINGNLDDRNVGPKSLPALARFTTWSIEDNITGWDAYLGPGHEFKNYIAPPAAPARLENMTELAPLYLDVGALDILRDEGIQYAMKVAKASVDVELHVYPGVPHSFEAFCPQTNIAKMAMQNRVPDYFALQGFAQFVETGATVTSLRPVSNGWLSSKPSYLCIDYLQHKVHPDVYPVRPEKMPLSLSGGAAKSADLAEARLKVISVYGGTS